MLVAASFTSWIHHIVACMGGCFGCCTKPSPIIAVDEPSKGLRIQGRTVKKPSLSEDFWSTSPYEMDNSGVQSQRSISSISTSNQNPDPHSGQCSTGPTEFVNHGFLLWNQIRQEWVGNRPAENRTPQVREPRLRKWWISWWMCGSKRACTINFPYQTLSICVTTATKTNTIILFLRNKCPIFLPTTIPTSKH
ncbi:uncharacterized protein LOC18431891 isoform X2 [Amborella trichopoda]|uniref:uncharacterized protein LOC18431891 isoform X2 n=1 Tax=Amborella trichopoda TaxID=13333 RepID=UPI0005D39C7B|nr:uncharacterized protein LOC18431891 isoform X2 [Amborella trichopoda]|eukprot:XP_011622472.1 uncharacterized protein LOC18431891 isoform X2 [Amborella trichopoda]